MDLLTNPRVIIVIVLSVVIGNIAALKYTAKNEIWPDGKKESPQEDSNKPSENNEQDPPQ